MSLLMEGATLAPIMVKEGEMRKELSFVLNGEEVWWRQSPTGPCFICCARYSN